MKLCPICNISNCSHEKKFALLGRIKILILKQALEKSVSAFSALVMFMPTDPGIQVKMNFIVDALKECLIKMQDIQLMYDKSIAHYYDNK